MDMQVGQRVWSAHVRPGDENETTVWCPAEVVAVDGNQFCARVTFWDGRTVLLLYWAGGEAEGEWSRTRADWP